MGTSKLLGKSDEMLEHKGPIQGEVIILVVCLCYMETGQPRLGGSLGLSTNFLIAK